MERVSTFTTSPSLRPSCFFSHGVFPHSNKLHPTSETTSFRIKPISVKATNRNTLSTDWNLSGSIAAPSMPSLDDLDTTNMLLSQRIVFLGSQVDEASADFVISQLLLLDAEDPTKDIKLFINSPGGSTTCGMGIYDAMKLCKADISTVCWGIAASITAFLLAAGTKGKRFCMPNGRVMLHHPPGYAQGIYPDYNLRLREINYQKLKVNKILSRITGKPLKQIEKDLDLDNFMNPWEAKEYGLIDGVIDDGKPGLVAPIADSSPPPKTSMWHEWKIAEDKEEKRNMPSEEKLLLNDREEVQASNEEKGEATQVQASNEATNEEKSEATQVQASNEASNEATNEEKGEATQGEGFEDEDMEVIMITDRWKMPNFDRYLHTRKDFYELKRKFYESYEGRRGFFR